MSHLTHTPVINCTSSNKQKKLYFQKVYVETLIYLLAKWYIFIMEL